MQFDFIEEKNSKLIFLSALPLPPHSSSLLFQLLRLLLLFLFLPFFFLFLLTPWLFAVLLRTQWPQRISHAAYSRSCTFQHVSCGNINRCAQSLKRHSNKQMTICYDIQHNKHVLIPQFLYWQSLSVRFSSSQIDLLTWISFLSHHIEHNIKQS
jgi:hypothetical protein